jgi:Kef-type K+ transport system membrane component KefB
MNRIIRSIDPYILGGFVGSLFAGLIGPYHIKLIASALDVRVITLGSLAGSLFPFLSGLAFENRRLARRLYARLPLIMTVEVGLTAAAIWLYALDLSLYYLASMIVFGTFTSAVMYLLQILKQRRYRRGRAAFDRRYAMADAAGYLAGSLLALADLPPMNDLRVLLALSLAQTAVVYLIYLRFYLPGRRPVSRPVRRRTARKASRSAARPDPRPLPESTLLTSD